MIELFALDAIEADPVRSCEIEYLFKPLFVRTVGDDNSIDTTRLCAQDLEYG